MQQKLKNTVNLGWETKNEPRTTEEGWHSGMSVEWVKGVGELRTNCCNLSKRSTSRPAVCQTKVITRAGRDKNSVAQIQMKEELNAQSTHILMSVLLSQLFCDLEMGQSH